MTTSTINTNNPPANTPVASAPVRANFQAAANDINNLWAYVEALITGVSSFNGRTGDVVLLDSDITDALGYDPSLKMANYFWVIPTAQTISLVPYAEYAFTIQRLNNLVLSAGSLTLTISINGTPVTGLDGLSVTTSPLNPTASGANIVAAGDEVTMDISSVSGADNLKFSMLSQV